MKKPVLFGKYLLVERINAGGMAEVFIAKHFGVEGFEKILAIKKILPALAEDEDFISMFVDEARITVQLNHANIAHILDFGKSDENYFIAMEYVAGKDLRAILEHHRRRKDLMDTAQAVYIASKMCEGLEYAHRKKDARGNDLHIIHRDVSPQNVLVSYEGEVKLIDFGIAKAANRNQKTQAGILKGKFGYMSPEQVRGLEIDRRSDLFAVGVILYELLTGEKLFVGHSDFSTLEKVRDAHVPMPSHFNPKIPAGLEKIVLQSLAREPDDRYQWASDLHEDLMRYLVVGDQIYSSKHLARFMKTAFAEDLLREAERMERVAGAGMSSTFETPAGAVRPIRAAMPEPSTVAHTYPSIDVRRGPRVVIDDDDQSPAGATMIGALRNGNARSDEGPYLPDGDAPDGASGGEQDVISPRSPAEGARKQGGGRRKLAFIGGAAAVALVVATAALVVFPGKSRASVVLTVTPREGATVLLNGKPIPSGELRDLEPGNYAIEASAPGHETARRHISLRSGENAPIVLSLARRSTQKAEQPSATPMFTARFVANVPGVEIRVADRLIGTTPAAAAPNLDVGSTYRFTARKQGFEPYEGTFTAEAEGEIEVPVVLQQAKRAGGGAKRDTQVAASRDGNRGQKSRATGGLACSTRPAGAEVLVDGKPTGRFTPVALANPVVVSVGNRVVQFRMSGKKTAPRVVEIKGGEVARLVNVPIE
jgi:hypothetical protein